MHKFFSIAVFFLLISTPIFCQPKNPLIKSGEILNAASVLCDSGQFNHAVDTILYISKGDTGYLQALTDLAYAYLMDKKYAEAIRTVNKALIYPSTYKHRLILIKGNAYDNWGYSDSAILVYTEALKKYPYSYLIYYNLGIGYRNAKKYDKAVEALQQSIIRNPYYASSHLVLGRLMGQMGQYTHAMLSLETYLVIEPSANRTNASLVFLNNLVNDAMSEDFERIQPCINNKAFEETDQLIKSKIAMNTGFKSKIKFNAPVSKQTQLLFESLKYKANTGDFWMDYYVPMFIAVEEGKHFENFSYKLLMSTPDETVASQLKKRKKAIVELNSLLSLRLDLFSKNQSITDNGTKRIVDFFLNESNYLVSVGKKAADGDTRIGQWDFYYTNCEPKASGKYTDSGKLNGLWLNYDEDGSLNLEEHYLDGELHGNYIGYYASGNKKYIAKYDKGNLNDDVTYYYDCDNLVSSVVRFENGSKNGKETIYYKNGVISETSYYKNDSLEGEAEGFFAQGSIKWKYNYKDNKLDGMAIDYFRNGKISYECTYLLGKRNGLFNSFYVNGVLAETGTYKDDKRIGIWKEYNDKGLLTETSNYSEKGELHGENKGYTETGKLRYSSMYVNGKEKEYTYFDVIGKPFYTLKIADKTIPAKGFYSDGLKYFDGFYSNGEIEGEWTYFNKSGKVQSVKNYKNGKLDGQFVSYYPTGEKLIECMYTAGDLNGYYKKYFVNGIIETEGWYVEGNQEGKWISRNPNGTLNETTEYLNGGLNGFIDAYSPNEKLQYITEFKNGKIASIEAFDNLGNSVNYSKFDGTNDYVLYYFDKKIRAKAEFKCNYLNSKFTFYTKAGKVDTEFDYLNDSKDGKFTSWHNNGKLYKEGFYESGNITGLWKIYDEKGYLDRKGNYFNDEKDSTWTAYHENGKIRYIENYNQGKLSDTSYYYDKFGEFMYSLVFDKFGLVSYQYSTQSGNVSKTISPKDTGIIIAYYKNGKVSAELSYKYGNLEGKQLSYFSNGANYKEFYLKNDDLEGKKTEYFENGKEKLVENFLLGNYHGECKYYRPDGTLERTEEYVSNDEHGTFVYYNEQGKVLRTEKYWGTILLD